MVYAFYLLQNRHYIRNGNLLKFAGRQVTGEAKNYDRHDIHVNSVKLRVFLQLRH